MALRLPPEEIPPPKAEVRQYGDPADPDMWAARCDRLESFLLDASNPRRNMQRGAHGFDVEAAKALTAVLRQAYADGALTAEDFAVPADAGAVVYESAVR